MEQIDLVSKATVDDLIFQKFESPLPKAQDDDDPFIKGEFDVIKELLEKMPATAEVPRTGPTLTELTNAGVLKCHNITFSQCVQPAKVCQGAHCMPSKKFDD